jgi:hypothetical protein
MRRKGELSAAAIDNGWPVSKRVNSSKADGNNATPIDPVELAAA